MRAADYPYPPDEFDAAAAGGPQGVHRRPRSTWGRWSPFLLVLVLVPVLAYGAVTFLTGRDSGSTGKPAAPDQSSSADPQSSADPSTSADPDPAAPGPAETPAEEPAPPADLARGVEVLNATATSGLASGAKSTLAAAGFTAVTSGNFPGRNPATSIVYYTTPADVTTAAAVAAALGIAAVEESVEKAPDGIVAVLAADYKP